MADQWLVYHKISEIHVFHDNSWYLQGIHI